MVDFLLVVKMCFIMLKYWGYNALDNATLHRLTCKMPLLQKKWNKKNSLHDSLCVLPFFSPEASHVLMSLKFDLDTSCFTYGNWYCCNEYCLTILGYYKILWGFWHTKKNPCLKLEILTYWLQTPHSLNTSSKSDQTSILWVSWTT